MHLQERLHQRPGWAVEKPTYRMASRGGDWLIWTLALALVARLTIGSRQRSDFDTVDPLALTQIVIVGAMAAKLILSGGIQALLRRILRTPEFMLLSVSMVGMVSSLWSPIPLFTFYRAFEYAVLFACILLACQRFNSRRDLETVVVIANLITIGLSLVALVMKYGFMYSKIWHTNSYSACAAMGASYCLGELIVSSKTATRKLLVVSLVLCVSSLVVGTSTASNLSTIIAIIATAFLGRRWSWLVVGVIAIVGAAALFGLDDLVSTMVGGKSEDQILRLGGRDNLWLSAWEQFLNSPILGHGYAATARIGLVIYTTQTHNSLLSIATGVGMVGVSLAMTGLVWRWLSLARGLRNPLPYAGGTFAAVTAGIVNSMSTAYYGDCWDVPSLSFCAFLGLAVSLRREKQ